MSRSPTSPGDAVWIQVASEATHPRTRNLGSSGLRILPGPHQEMMSNGDLWREMRFASIGFFNAFNICCQNIWEVFIWIICNIHTFVCFRINLNFKEVTPAWMCCRMLGNSSTLYLWPILVVLSNRISNPPLNKYERKCVLLMWSKACLWSTNLPVI